ncbi:BspA family leucine-rich repeat surface protein [Candidatus Saccharibacteria bacterium]|nr:BspA family leucine-rich repeat surface protein [Candidatus Saccharibacteria bacterium]
MVPSVASAAKLPSNDVELKSVYRFASTVEDAVNISISNENEWKPAKTITINYSVKGSGLKNQYSTDGGSTWKNYSAPFEVAKNNTKILARTVDAAGDIIISAEKTAIKIDPVVPTVSISLAGSYYSGQALDLSSVTTYSAGESGATLRWFIGDVELHNLSDSYLIDRLEEQYEVEVKAVATSGAGLSGEDYSETIIIKYARWDDYLIGDLARDNIGNMKFVNYANMPGDEADWTDISVNQDGAVMEYYELNSETNLYDVYIASPYGYSRYKTDSMGSNLAYSTDANTSHTTSSSTGGAGTCQDGNYGLFAYMPNLKTIDFAYLDMFNINDMSCMFASIDFTTNFWDANSNLTSINWGEKFNTENVTNMSYAFAGLTKLQSLDLSSFDMGSVESIEGIFARNETLETLELANWDTSKITNMKYAFYETPNLKDYNVEGWETPSLISMRGMFYGSGIESLNLSGWDTSHVNSFYHLFEKTPNLHYVNMKGLNTSSVVDMAYMFERCGVYELDLSSFNTANVTNMDSMFYSANQLKTLDLQSFNTAQVTNMDYMFGNMTSLESINLDSFDTSNVSIIRALFYNDTKLKTVHFRHLDMSSATDARYMYYNTSSLQNIFVERVPTIKAGANTGYMWYASRINGYTVKEYGD